MNYRLEKGTGYDGNIAVCDILRLVDYPTENPDNYAVKNIGSDRVWEINKKDYMSKVDQLKREIEALERI